MTSFLDFPNTHPAWRHLQSGKTYYTAAAPNGAVLHGSSALKLYKESPPKYLRWTMIALAQAACQRGQGTLQLRRQVEEMMKEFQPTPAMNFGSMVDAYLFNQLAEMREIERTQNFRTLERVYARVRALRTHPEIGPYVTSKTLRPQVAHAWQDPATGLWLKMRMDAVDYIDARPTYWDLKVWQRCEPAMCLWNVNKWGVKIQMALYRRGARDLWNVSPRQGILVSGPKMNDIVYLRWIDDKDLDVWDEELGRLLGDLKRSWETMDFADKDAVGTLATEARREA